MNKIGEMTTLGGESEVILTKNLSSQEFNLKQISLIFNGTTQSREMESLVVCFEDSQGKKVLVYPGISKDFLKHHFEIQAIIGDKISYFQCVNSNLDDYPINANLQNNIMNLIDITKIVIKVYGTTFSKNAKIELYEVTA